MSEMEGPWAGEAETKPPRSGCWFWGLVIAGAVVGLLAILVALVMVPVIVGGGYRPPKQAEAKTNLGAIFTTQVAYYGENSTYAGGKYCFELMGWEPEGDTRFNYYCGDEVIYCNRAGCDRCLNTKLPGGGANKPGGSLDVPGSGPDSALPSRTPGHSTQTILDGARSTQEAFTVYAVGNVDGDTHCDVWSMRDNKELRNDYNDVAD
jgi:type IV pilus assembly protein PilA